VFAPVAFGGTRFNILVKEKYMHEATDRHGTAEANWVNVVLGAWVIISPFVLGFRNLPNAMWNNAIIGALVLLLALTSGPGSRVGSPLNVLLGLWLVVSPFVLGFAAAVPFWNNIILGAIIAIVAIAGRVEWAPAAPQAR
jgi:hypothetical protein